jgi:hypothetical protein
MQQNQEVQVPTKDQLVAQASQMIIQRATLKDQVDQIEKQLPTVQALIQLLTAQEAEAEAKQAEVSKD